MNNTIPTKGYYSILQFVPDLERAEGANIGVVLFCPAIKFIKARTARGNDRVRRIFGNSDIQDLARLNILKQSFEERIELESDRILSAEDFRQFIDSRANQLLLTEPRPVKVFDAEAELENLYSMLVGGRHRNAGKTSHLRDEQ